MFKIEELLKSGNIEEVNKDFLSIEEEIKAFSLVNFDPSWVKRDIFAEVLFTGEMQRSLISRQRGKQTYSI